MVLDHEDHALPSDTDELDAYEQSAVAPIDDETGADTPDVLEDLMNETRADALADTDPLAELLAESLAATREELEAKAARERRKRGGQSAAEAAEDAERLRRWELAHEWKPVANVALFERHTCDSCGRHQTIFRQLMTRQQHRHLRDSQRWQQAEGALTDLPNEVVVQKWSSPMCPACAPQAGFEFRNVTEWTQ